MLPGKVGLAQDLAERELDKTGIHIYRRMYIRDLEMTPLTGMMLATVGVALLNKMLKGRIWPPTESMKTNRKSKDKVIEINDYEILD